MRRVFATAAVFAFVGLGIGNAASQVDVELLQPQVRMVQKTPGPLVIAPSDAIRAALRANPGAQAINVKPRGNMYIVKLKQGNTIRQVRVNGTTGVVLP